MEKDDIKVLGKVSYSGSINIKFIDKEFLMIMKGWKINYKPKGFFSRLVWRFIEFDVEYTEAPSLWELIPKVKMPEIKYKNGD